MYWERIEDDEVLDVVVKGIVVVFGWVSVDERELRNQIELYRSFGWSCLVSYADFITA